MKKENKLLMRQIEDLMLAKFKIVGDNELELLAEFTKYKYKCSDSVDFSEINHIKIIIRDNNDWAFDIVVNNEVSEEFTGNGLESLLNCLVSRLFKMGLKYNIIYRDYELDNKTKYEIIKLARMGRTTGEIKKYLESTDRGSKDGQIIWDE